MSFKLKIIGGVMALAGLAVSGFGWPYRMLDWGSIQVMLGSVLAMGGILLTALGFALQEVHAHIGRLLKAAGQVPPDGIAATPADMPVGPSVTAPAPEPVAPTAPEANSGTAGLAAAAAAGAAVIAGAALATGQPGEAKDAAPETEPSFPPAGGLPKFDLDSFADEALARIAPVRDVAGSPIDELTAKINEAVGDIDLLRKGVSPKPAPEPVIDIIADPDPAPEADEAAASILPDPVEPVPAEDEPEPDPEPDVAEVVETVASEPDEHDVPERDETADDDEPEVEQAEEEGAEQDTPAEAAPVAPVTSAEGIVGVHKVGASTFTMYADGTIRAETPEGAFGFNSVAELKTYLAGDKSVARPL